MSDPLTCGEALMDLLSQYEVDTVFGMPGTHTVELYRGISRSEIRHIQCRNEQGASLMADGYARATGKPGVCTIVTGPGVTNASTGMAQAYCDSQPMLVLSGACATRTLGKGWGTVHELDDQSAVTRSFTALSAMTHHHEELPELVARSFAVFRGGRARPVHISLPWDILPSITKLPWRARNTPSRPMPDPSAIHAGAEVLANSKRAMILVGGGAIGSGKSIKEVAEIIGATVLTTNAGKGVLPESHPLSLGCSILSPHAHAELAAADVVLIIGSEVAEGDHFLPELQINGKIVRIDIDPTELVSLYAPTVAIQSDAVFAMRALAATLTQYSQNGQNTDAENRVTSIKAKMQADLTDVEKQHIQVWNIIRNCSDDDAIVMGDISQIVYTGSFAMPLEMDRCWFYPGTYCALGVALPMAIGAKIGAPERQVIAVTGDGGFMFTANELATAVEEKLPIPIVVWNNFALKEIVDQMDRRQMPRLGVEPATPNFVALAKSFGANGVCVDSAAQLGSAILNAYQATGPTLIEVQQDSPWLVT